MICRNAICLQPLTPTTITTHLYDRPGDHDYQHVETICPNCMTINRDFNLEHYGDYSQYDEHVSIENDICPPKVRFHYSAVAQREEQIQDFAMQLETITSVTGFVSAVQRN